jgi:hypothetical protein
MGGIWGRRSSLTGSQQSCCLGASFINTLYSSNSSTFESPTWGPPPHDLIGYCLVGSWCVYIEIPNYLCPKWVFL